MRLKTIGIVLLLLVSMVWAQTDNEEFRATWVITWEHISAGSSVEQNQARIRTIMDNHLAANMSSVLFQARQSGTAYYNSSYEPWGAYAGGSSPGYDPLEYAIEQAHARGLELHAWFNCFQAASTVPGAPAAEHPDWVCRDEGGAPMPAYRALSPGMPEVREYLVDVAMEIVNNYDVDGLHLDYVRWNEYDNLLLNSVSPTSLEEVSTLDQETDYSHIGSLRDSQSGRYLYDIDHPYNGGVPAGFDSWPDFWRSSVTDFVHSLHDSMQTQKPWVRLSVAALGKYNWSGWNGYNVVYQDAALWFNEGYIDQLTPMHYHWTTSSGFVGMLTDDSPYCWGDYIQPGVNAGRLFSVGPGSYILDQNNIWNRHASIVNISRSVSWVDGFQFFSYGSWQDYQYWPTAGSSFFSKKTKIRGNGLFVDETPPTPAIALDIVDSLTFDLTVTPDNTATGDYWWALYRSQSDDIMVTSSDIVGVYFGSEAFTVTEEFDGTQDENTSYFYSATMLDRYWNESELATAVETSQLPSLPPVLTSVYPAQDDTVEVSTLLTIQFSKTMDVASVESSLSFSPEIAIDHYTWTEGDHRIIIYPDTNFAYMSSYTMTLTDAAMDINGSALDGDADGTAGGDIIITFHTKALDEAGPTVLYSTPEINVGTESFDVDGNISLVFDEMLNSSTVNLESIHLEEGGTPIEVDYLLSTAHGKSVLDIKPYSRIGAASDYLLTLDSTLADALGNTVDAQILIPFSTANEHYSTINYIDSFTFTNEWWDPEGSGSTVGTIGSTTNWGYSTSIYLPGTSTVQSQKRAGFINYEWDLASGSHLLREYMPSGGPRNVIFDNTYIMQCYVYGDGSNNKFRFAIDEGDGTDWPAHEVSVWFDIDWEGWRLLEWDFTDPSMVGNWIGNGTLDGQAYRVDSFQMTYNSESGATSGRIYLDNFRVVKKMPGVSIDDELPELPQTVSLHQNYPNPFNPETVISFDLPSSMEVEVSVFDIRGRELEILVNDNLPAGRHTLHFNGSDFAAGVYMVVLETQFGTQAKRMLLLK
ncbi:MAG: family 10 glycosylhydrolase [FCB group bacterium]|nr:family 10 glycosylhydrolase [FCB group bacterium]MBL7027552.1 family 10 glycosylhydrolase [Candidatus Neomarinimicrobiota bacterium]MBL7121182.1 family 10 glycosylhydrolase [Candidatus Neomarinimicrobiota bacterium]